jgi:hypothetical protein
VRPRSTAQEDEDRADTLVPVSATSMLAPALTVRRLVRGFLRRSGKQMGHESQHLGYRWVAGREIQSKRQPFPPFLFLFSLSLPFESLF